MRLHYPPDYVLDEMQWYEIIAALKYQHYAIKDEWEQARLVSYIMAQCNSKSRLKLEDIVKFYWEKEEGEDDPDDKEVTPDDVHRMQNTAARMKDLGIIK